MQSITPCQRTISDRFPVASFVVRVPPARVFEIACATDPTLLRADARARRTEDNFYTSRSGGLLRAPAGHATVLLPPAQLRRFAGRTRLYYMLGTYGPRGEEPVFSAPLDRPDMIPAVAITPDFTGRALDRSRIGRSVDGRYGGPKPILTWGGDLMAAPTTNGNVDAGEHANPAQAMAAEYDDGYGPDLWTSAPAPAALNLPDPPDPLDPPDPGSYGGVTRYGGAPAPTGPGAHELYGSPARRAAIPSEAPGFEDAPALYGSPARRAAIPSEAPGFEDAPALYGSRARRAASPAEASGFEDAPAARRAGGGAPVASYGGTSASSSRTTVRATSFDEPPGAEDAPNLRQVRPGNGGMRAGWGNPQPMPAPHGDFPAAQGPARYGARPAVARALDAAPAQPAPDMAVDDLYEDADPAHAAFAIVVPELAVSGEALTIRRKLELLVPIADLTSGAERYAAVTGSVEYDDSTHPAYQRVHHGVHWGLLGLTQRSGLLGKALVACQRRDDSSLRRAFGDSADHLVRVTTAAQPDERLQPVDGAFLWQPPWIDRFRRAGAEPAIQAAQNEIAVEQLVDPQLRFAAILGLTTDRAVAMLVDRCVQMGVGGGRRWVVDTLSPIGEDPARLRQALGAVGATDLAAFQTSIGLPADGRLGTETHAVLLGALRTLGARSPFSMPDVPAMLDRLVSAAQGRRFAARIGWLRHTPSYRDVTVQIG